MRTNLLRYILFTVFFLIGTITLLKPLFGAILFYITSVICLVAQYKNTNNDKK